MEYDFLILCVIIISNIFTLNMLSTVLKLQEDIFNLIHYIFKEDDGGEDG